MIAYIVNLLCDKYNIKRDEAFMFYMQVVNKHKQDHLIINIDKFDCYEALKFYLLGGKENEL